MRNPRTFAVLKWVGPAFLAIVYGLPQTVATVGSTFPGVKAWAEKIFSAWWPIVTSPWFIGIMIFLVIGYVSTMVFCGTGQPKVPVAKSEIEISDIPFLDCDAVTSAWGGTTQDLYSVALCLQVQNGRSDGKALKNLRARMYNGFGDNLILPNHDTGAFEGDLRKGETEFIELGRVLVWWTVFPVSTYETDMRH